MMSPSSAVKAEKLGFTNVRVFHDGLPAWKKAGNLVVSTAGYVKENMDKDIPQILVDLRPADETKREHISGAVSIPGAAVNAAKDRLPADKKAPIVLYAGDAKTAADAFNVIRGWGYTNISVLDGGIDEWKKSGNPVASGEPQTVIVYVPKPRPGEITIEEFKRLAETLPQDKLILDVRDEDEAMQGMLKGARNIPAQEISGKLTDLPKEKEIIAHCVTGVRAEMAYLLLKEQGYKVRFLNADIKIDKDGKYEITKE
jgi:rhodanese-related sulfurtransferase